MPTITLTETQQLALCALLSLETTRRHSTRASEMRRLIEAFVPCDAIRVAVPGGDAGLPAGVAVDGADHEPTSIALDFRDADGAMVEVWFDRRCAAFTQEDLGRMVLIAPFVRELLRERATLSAVLTAKERKALLLVADGLSNSEIAAHLFVSVGTVRKHLENAYRKLGVHNRMAAVVALAGGPVTDNDHAGPVHKYA